MSNKPKLSKRQWTLVVFSMLVVIWIMGLITFSTYMMFFNISLINGSSASAYSALLGILSTLTGFLSKQIKEFYG